MRSSLFNNRLNYYLATIGLVIGWEVLSRIINNPIIIPSPAQTMLSLIEIAGRERFVMHITRTLVRSFQSFGLSVVLALIFGVLSGLYRWVNHFMVPILSLLRSVPTMAVIILALIWLSSDTAPVMIGLIVVFPILYESVRRGMMSVDYRLIEMANLYSVGRADIIRDIYMPTIYMYLSSVIGSSLGLTLKTVIAGEVLGQPRFSIGASLQLEKLFLNTAGVFAWIVVVVILATLLEYLVRFAFAKTENWK
jgi:NitT/TauT family transport system permease protein